MFPHNLKAASFLILLTCLSGIGSSVAPAQQTKRPFTVVDEIGLAHFGDPYEQRAEAVRFSPDGSYFAVDTERGRLDLNKVEDSLRFYRSADIEHFVEYSDQPQAPSPVWVVSRSAKEGPIINGWHWLADSSGVAFLERTDSGNPRLVLADLTNTRVEPLTSTMEMVKAFDIRDREHYVYVVADPTERKKWEADRQKPVIAVSGRSLHELLFPDSPIAISILSAHSNLWAVVDGKRFEVKQDGVPFAYVDTRNLALSPDGRVLVTMLPVRDVSRSWEILYPPPFPSSHWRIHADQNNSAHQYVRINLQTGSVQSLTEAPSSNDAGWWDFGTPSWSSDGQAILLPGTFIESNNNEPSRPCVATIDLSYNTRTCVEVAKAEDKDGKVEKGYHLVRNAAFVHGDKHRIEVSFYNHDNAHPEAIDYRQAADGTWQVVGQSEKWRDELEHGGPEVTVRQGLNDPPMLVATEDHTSRVIWDPNPQFKNIDLGPASVYTWKDTEGRDWKGGLFKPIGYKAGLRYPLVIQTHGFTESQFEPSGAFPTAFVARALAAVGIAVLQVDEPCPVVTPDEGPCAVSGYESAANQLVSEGLVDPQKIGTIGFSRTCFYVMEMLSMGSLHLKAASITSGVMGDYLQYILFTDTLALESNAMIGAQPFGEGLQQWLKQSPGFQLDKISAPLLVIGEGPWSLLSMWQPYAGLRYLHKPVDLLMLNTDEHVLTNPAVRRASQGGSVDWFRFWLQDYEDPDPAKAEQYTRWRGLRKLQEANGSRLTKPQAASH